MPLKTRLDLDSKNSKIICISSIVWAMIGAIAFFSMGEDFAYYMTCIFFFMLPGLWGYKYGKMKKERVERTERYAQVLEIEPTGSLESIAVRCGLSSEQVREELEDLIKRRYLQNAYIDNELNCIVVRDRENRIMTQEVKMEIVTCKRCIGNNKVIKGKVHSCEYCGSLLED